MISQQQTHVQLPQQNQNHLSQLAPPTPLPSVSPKMPSHVNGNQIPQSAATPQPQSQQTPIQQPPRAASVPGAHPPTPTATPPPNMQQPQSKVPSQQPVLTVEDSNEEFKPLMSVSQEGTSSVSQMDTQQNTPSSTSDQGSVQTGGKIFSFASQKSTGEIFCSEKMEIDCNIKTENGKSNSLLDIKPCGKPDIGREVKEEPREEGVFSLASIKTETLTMKDEPKTPEPSASVGENCINAKADPSSDSKSKPNKKSEFYYYYLNMNILYIKM